MDRRGASGRMNGVRPCCVGALFVMPTAHEWRAAVLRRGTVRDAHSA
jgi:hypothetical protein